MQFIEQFYICRVDISHKMTKDKAVYQEELKTGKMTLNRPNGKP